MNSRGITFIVWGGALVLGSLALRELAGLSLPRDWAMPPAQREPGVGLMLGGFRALAANVAWLRVQSSWEKKDATAILASLRRTVALDSRPLTFWINGARMLAYDMAEWQISAGGGERDHPGLRERVDRNQAQLALQWLRDAEQAHPHAADLLIERANIQLNRARDLPAAAESYRLAAAQPGAPRFAARLHGEMLRRLGQKTEAYAWLIRLHPTLPRDDEDAAADLVLARIRNLEKELGTTDVYRPSG